MKNNILEKNHDKCTSCGICEAVCPKEIEITNIARLNREYLHAGLASDTKKH